MVHKLFIQIDMTLNYIFLVDNFIKKCICRSFKHTWAVCARSAPTAHGCIRLVQRHFLKGSDQKYSLGSYLVVYIAYGQYLCNKIMFF